MKLIIDRIEADMAVVELPDKTIVAVPREFFEDVCEGAVYEIIKKDAKSETEEIEEFIESVWED